MLYVFIALASLTAYLYVGFRFIAPGYITRGVERHIDRWPSLTEPHELARERDEKAWEAAFVVPVWPIYLAFRMFVAGLMRHGPMTSVEQDQKIREQQKYIERLERETGIR